MDSLSHRTAEALQGAAFAAAADFTSSGPSPTLNSVGLSSFARASAGPGNSDANAIVGIGYHASRPGLFDITFRGDALGGGGASASWTLTVGPNPGEITEIFGPGGTVLGPLAFGQPAGWFTASGIFDGNRTRCNPFPNCNFFPTSIGSEISNVGLGVLTDAAISDTMTFRAETTNF